MWRGLNVKGVKINMVGVKGVKGSERSLRIMISSV